MVVEVIDKEDLELANHLAGHRRKYLRVKFNNVTDLMDVSARARPTHFSPRHARRKKKKQWSSRKKTTRSHAARHT